MKNAWTEKITRLEAEKTTLLEALKATLPILVYPSAMRETVIKVVRDKVRAAIKAAERKEP